ncbi:MAG: hypothetical protein WCO37_08050 [Bacteroidota bacterium]
MKKTKAFYLILLLLFFVSAIDNFTYSQAKKGNSSKNVEEDDEEQEGKLPEGFTQDDKIHYLEMQCEVTEPTKENGKISSVVVPVVLFRIYDDKGALIKAVFADEKGKCKFRLGFQKKYKIIISRKGFYSKILSIDTKIPTDLNTAYIFPADITFYREQEKLDAKIFKEPIAIIVFSSKTKQFEYDNLYSKKLDYDLKKIKTEYLKLLK